MLGAVAGSRKFIVTAASRVHAVASSTRFHRMSESQLHPLIRSAEEGGADARRQLFAVLYEELRRIAQRELRRCGGALTLGATTLLHEAYLSISGRDALAFPDRARFMAYAARAMRGLVIDYARSRQAQKRGGGFEITSLPTQTPDVAVDQGELERIAHALDELAVVDAPLAELVDLKFFCGLSFGDIAAIRGVCKRTVQRDWEKARIFLYRSLHDAAPS
jgi:RNA polymerase sigma factor (TIGR02999 family)